MLVEIPTNPAPTGAVSGYIAAEDAVPLRFARFPPTGGRPRGTIALLQGRAEYIEKYFETARDLSALGFTVATFDWRGQGGSRRLLHDPRKGHIRSFDLYRRDLDAFARQILADCPRPHSALAHSMGALILFRMLAGIEAPFERAVLSTPLFGLGRRGARPARALVRLYDHLGLGHAFVPGSTGAVLVDLRPFASNPVTSDPDRHARNARVVEARPEIALSGPTIAWLGAALAAMDEVNAPGFAERVKTPCLLVAASRDAVVSNRAIEAMGRRLRTGRAVVIEGAMHELMTERDLFRAQFLAAVEAYLE